MSTPETTVVTIIVDDQPTGPTPTGRARTVVTPNPVRIRPGESTLLAVEIEDEAGRRPVTGFQFAPFLSGDRSPQEGPPIAAYRKIEKPSLLAHEILLEVPADYPAGRQVQLTVGGL